MLSFVTLVQTLLATYTVKSEERIMTEANPIFMY
jgi:hypothetical protein